MNFSSWLKMDRGSLVALTILLSLPLIGLLIAWPTTKGELRPLLVVLVPYILLALDLSTRFDSGFRVKLLQQVFKLHGPRAEASVNGSIPLDPQEAVSDTLNQIIAIAKKWRRDARVEAFLDSRVIIAAGPRTLTVNVRPVRPFDQTDEEPEESRNTLEFELRGYETRIGRMDHLLQADIAALLNELTRQLCTKGKEPNLSLNLSIDGKNPYLGFYLRGVPINKIDLFQARLTEEHYGNRVDVQVTLNLLSVQSRNPNALIDSARRYLASPALAHIN